MNNLEEKYIDLLLNRCVNFNNSKSLFINYDKVNKNFIEKLIKKAKEMGVTDIATDEDDIYLFHDKLASMTLEEIETDPYFNKELWNVYANKNAAFLMFVTEFPNIMSDIDQEKIALASYIQRTTRSIFRDKEINYQIPWCIAALPNEIWAKQLFPNEENANEKLFKVICDMCMITTENPIKSWDKYLKDMKKHTDYLNSIKIKSLHYSNNLGTDLTLHMPKNCIWNSAADKIEKNMFVNMPSYEVFTTPDYRKTNGIVYSSRPLIYNGGIINKFYLKFENGKVCDFGAEQGYQLLKNIIETDKNSSFLGEAALVNYDSPISNTKLVFGTTLFDENAACHLALGRGFNQAIPNGFNMNEEELLKNGINQSKTHVDFMIGTEDLNIEAETKNGKVLIFKNGNFNISK